MGEQRGLVAREQERGRADEQECAGDGATRAEVREEAAAAGAPLLLLAGVNLGGQPVQVLLQSR